MPPDIPAAKFRPTGPKTTTRPPVMYSQPWSPTPSATASAPGVADAEPLADHPAQEDLAAGGAVADHVACDDLLLGRERRAAGQVHDDAARRTAPCPGSRWRRRTAAA